MTAQTDRLTAALADRYRLERELGQGGMATVYLAEDVKHRREFRTQHLYGDPAFVLEVLGEVHRGHAALTELALDAVAIGKRGGETIAHGRSPSMRMRSAR